MGYKTKHMATAAAALGMALQALGSPAEAETDTAMLAEKLPDQPIEIVDLKLSFPKLTHMWEEKEATVAEEWLGDTAVTVIETMTTTRPASNLPWASVTGGWRMTPPPEEIETALSAGIGPGAKGTLQSIYSLPYSTTGTSHDWKRLWINTGVLASAFVGTLFVLECLPEDATTWNRAALQQVPLFDRWYDHVIAKGPEWDNDNGIFNYVLHPYAGAAYFMGARSCGFNFYQSLLYSTIVSTVGWEFGIEAFMERPSYQDLMITPMVGSVIGECFYAVKRHIVDHNYRLFDSRVLGNVVAFLVDPLNEFVGYFGGNPARKAGAEKEALRKKRCGAGVELLPGFKSLTLRVTF